MRPTLATTAAVLVLMHSLTHAETIPMMAPRPPMARDVSAATSVNEVLTVNAMSMAVPPIARAANALKNTPEASTMTPLYVPLPPGTTDTSARAGPPVSFQALEGAAVPVATVAAIAPTPSEAAVGSVPVEQSSTVASGANGPPPPLVQNNAATSMTTSMTASTTVPTASANNANHANSGNNGNSNHTSTSPSTTVSPSSSSSSSSANATSSSSAGSDYLDTSLSYACVCKELRRVSLMSASDYCLSPAAVIGNKCGNAAVGEKGECPLAGSQPCQDTGHVLANDSMCAYDKRDATYKCVASKEDFYIQKNGKRKTRSSSNSTVKPITGSSASAQPVSSGYMALRVVLLVASLAVGLVAIA